MGDNCISRGEANLIHLNAHSKECMRILCAFPDATHFLSLLCLFLAQTISKLTVGSEQALDEELSLVPEIIFELRL